MSNVKKPEDYEVLLSEREAKDYIVFYIALVLKNLL